VIDPEGQFELRTWSLEDKYAYAEADGYTPAFVPLVLTNGADGVEVEILLERGGIIEGRVVNMRGTPVQGARVSMEPAGFAATDAQTDARGAFRLSGVRQFGWLRVVHPDFAPYESKSYVGGESVGSYRQEANDVRDCLIRLSQGGSIEGLVLDGHGNPMAATRVTANTKNRGSANPSLSTLTDAKGRYRIDLVQPGTYGVFPVGLGVRYKMVIVREGEVTEVNFGPVGATVFGTIYLQGAPMPSIRVLLGDSPIPYGGERVQETKTNQEGAYVFQGVPPGDHHVIAYEDGRLGFVAVQTQEGQDLEQDIYIECGALSGKVVHRGNSPLGHARVLLCEAEIAARLPFGLGSYSDCDDVLTDADGRFFFSQIPAGDYVVQVGPLGNYGKASIEATIEPRQSIDDIVIAVEGGGVVEVTTVDAETGDQLSLTGHVFLQTDDRQVTIDGTKTPGRLTCVNLGVHYIGAAMRDEHRVLFCAPMATEVLIQRDEQSSVVLPMRGAVEVRISVVDAAGNPVIGIRPHVYTAAGAPYMTFAPDDLFVPEGTKQVMTAVPPGTIRLVLTKDNNMLYDDYLDIAPVPQGVRFETTVVVE